MMKRGRASHKEMKRLRDRMMNLQKRFSEMEMTQ
jgi:hypothetical protein